MKPRDRIRMRCPECGFVALGRPEEFVQEFLCPKCRQKAIFRRVERGGFAGPNREPASAWARWRRLLQAHPAWVGGAACLTGAIALLVLGARMQEAFGTARPASKIAHNAPAEPHDIRAELDSTFRNRLQEALRARTPEGRRDRLLPLRRQLAAIDYPLPVRQAVDNALIRALTALDRRATERARQQENQLQQLAEAVAGLREQHADMARKHREEDRAQEIAARASEERTERLEERLRVREAQLEQQLANRSREARTLAEELQGLKRALRHAQGVASERSKRIDQLEERLADRAARDANRLAAAPVQAPTVHSSHFEIRREYVTVPTFVSPLVRYRSPRYRTWRHCRTKHRPHPRHWPIGPILIKR